MEILVGTAWNLYTALSGTDIFTTLALPVLKNLREDMCFRTLDPSLIVSLLNITAF